MRQRVIAYIDGFNLFFGLKSQGWRRYYWLDVSKLAQQLLQPNQLLVETKYFTSRVTSATDPQKPKRQNTYLEALQTLPNLKIFYGHYLLEPRHCKTCGAIWQKHAEKMTDVNIATELITDAFQNRFDTAFLMSGDSDLTAPILSIQRLFEDKRVVVAFPPGRYSAALSNAATACFHLGRGKISASQLPEKVCKPDGYVLSRPPRWM
ncbi:MAG: NYN domain-containing protein [Pirellulales bacterium]|nr:NYN domain-containing protein [Pirellulales bacterium]